VGSTSDHGIYISTDGSTFAQNTSFPTTYAVYSLYVFNNTLYVGTSNHGIYTSTDGSTFAQNTSFPSTYRVHALCVFNNTLYVGLIAYPSVSTAGIYTFSLPTSNESLDNVAELLTVAARNFNGVASFKQAYVDMDSSKLIVDSDEPLAQAIIEYTKEA
jgi:hypothetical protein